MMYFFTIYKIAREFGEHKQNFLLLLDEPVHVCEFD